MRTSKTTVRGAFLLAVMVAVQGSMLAQLDPSAHSARSAAMGGCFVGSVERHADVCYVANYGLPDMADKSLSLVWPVGRGGVAAANYAHRGWSAYSEQMATADYAMRVAERLRLGIAVRYAQIAIADGHYDRQQWLSAGLAARYTFGSKIDVAAMVASRQWDKQRPVEAHVQVRYRPQEGWLTVVQLDSEERMRLRCGAEYLYEGRLAARVGLSTAPLAIGMGAGVRWQWMEIDVAMLAHQNLGLSPGLSLSLWF